mmetsp:Transcript_145524/g.466375  ORF Transcript_145524/g.466375 Transcript_145524/m.466375 type:complete len:357 (+) Transcript_145524:3724-4794(+)
MRPRQPPLLGSVQKRQQAVARPTVDQRRHWHRHPRTRRRHGRSKRCAGAPPRPSDLPVRCHPCRSGAKTATACQSPSNCRHDFPNFSPTWSCRRHWPCRPAMTTSCLRHLTTPAHRMNPKSSRSRCRRRRRRRCRCRRRCASGAASAARKRSPGAGAAAAGGTGPGRGRWQQVREPQSRRGGAAAGRQRLGDRADELVASEGLARCNSHPLLSLKQGLDLRPACTGLLVVGRAELVEVACPLCALGQLLLQRDGPREVGVVGVDAAPSPALELGKIELRLDSGLDLHELLRDLPDVRVRVALHHLAHPRFNARCKLFHLAEVRCHLVPSLVRQLAAGLRPGAVHAFSACRSQGPRR